ncbi:ATPase AAA [Streptomyces inusitatus]|uniref:ATPase AAA n=1 Tax=Streptomyces inusitatus TaxID=68221 RepID=A0A918Q2S1_9ACTN|nr:ATP-binding protein [Streptomyces inusitatus]GGZ31816.1 ATPase AAA [Streptomyces inusitatus]
MDHDSFGEGAGPKRPSREPGAPDFGQSAPPLARTVRIVAGDFLLTVNPVDGSEIEPCPPGVPDAADHPAPPVRRTGAERAEHQRAAQPPAPAGPAAPRPALLERDDERERITRLLARGRSLRVTGPAGSGRTALLDLVAEECADLAPDGVVRLNGRHRTATDLLYELFAAVHRSPRHRPGRARLPERIADIGAIVVLDDLEFGGAALGELLDSAPECAFLLAALPDAPEPAADAHLEEIVLTGLGRGASMELLRRSVDRPLAEDEANWAGDLWFESEGLPLRFVQAGALLRQRDELRERLREDPDAFEAFAPPEGVDGTEVALPTLGQGAAPAPLLASRLGEAARQTLRLAVALGGEVPHQAHLPALVGDTHADAAIGELMNCGLLSPVGVRYRLAAGVRAQLVEKGYAEESAAHAHTAAQHYTWWVGHPSVTPERACAEADAVVAALTALVTSDGSGHPSAAVLLARSAAPALAAGLHWGAWERVLRTGCEAARKAGEVAEEAYFHHELGILALSTDRLDRARAELETSIGMRGVLADKSGTVAGRRALTLVDDRENGRVPSAPLPGSAEAPTARVPATRPALSSPPAMAALPPGTGAGAGAADRDEAAPAPGTRPFPVVSGTVEVPRTFVPYQPPRKESAWARRGRVLLGTRRNLLAAAAGALLVAVLGTAVTLGAVSDEKEPPSGGKVGNGQSVKEEEAPDGLEADEPATAPGEPGPSVPGAVPAATTGATTTRSAVPVTGTPSATATTTPTAGTTPRPDQSTSDAPTTPSAPASTTGTGSPTGTGGPTTVPTATVTPTATAIPKPTPTNRPTKTTRPTTPTPTSKPKPIGDDGTQTTGSAPIAPSTPGGTASVPVA